MTKKLLFLALTAALFLTALCGCAAAEAASAFSDSDADGVISFSGSRVDISGAGITVADDGDVEISAAGTYVITGASSSARVVVKAAETDAVTLILADADLTYEADEVIYVKTAASAALVLADGTENTITSGTAPDGGEDASDGGEEDGEDASGAAIRARCDLTVSGSGSVTVYGYINNGIAANGNLTIDSGSFTVTAVNDGIKSKADLTINGGTFVIDADMDGIQADGAMTVNSGDFTILTGSGSEGADIKTGDSAMMGGGMGDRGGASGGASGENGSGASGEAQTDSEEQTGGETPASFEMPASGEMPTSGEMGGMFADAWDMDSADSGSHKGLKGVESVTITGGTFSLDTEDDAVHSDGDAAVTGGTFIILSGDDGVHADESLTITGGDMDIQYCYEGLEARSILIEGGYISIVASDDGMNANGGGGMFGMMGGFGAASSEASDSSSDSPVLRITGGTVYVDAGGDGLDSNGSLYIDGGEVYVSGPASGWDAAIDFGEGSSEFLITGGVLMAGGYSSMAEAPDSTDGVQPSIYYTLDSYAEAGAAVTLTDADGAVAARYAFANSFDCVVISAPALTVGGTYTLSVEGLDDVTIELTDTNYSNRSMGGSGEMGGPGGMGGSRG